MPTTSTGSNPNVRRVCALSFRFVILLALLFIAGVTLLIHEHNVSLPKEEIHQQQSDFKLRGVGGSNNNNNINSKERAAIAIANSAIEANPTDVDIKRVKQSELLLHQQKQDEENLQFQQQHQEQQQREQQDLKEQHEKLIIQQQLLQQKLTQQQQFQQQALLESTKKEFEIIKKVENSEISKTEPSILLDLSASSVRTPNAAKQSSNELIAPSPDLSLPATAPDPPVSLSLPTNVEVKEEGIDQQHLPPPPLLPNEVLINNNLMNNNNNNNNNNNEIMLPLPNAFEDSQLTQEERDKLNGDSIHPSIVVPKSPQSQSLTSNVNSVVNKETATDKKNEGVILSDVVIAVVEDPCEGSRDPFEKQPVEDFHPPSKAPFELKMQWEDAVKDMLDAIKQITIGGPTLREHLKKEVRKMQLMRFKMFCKYA